MMKDKKTIAQPFRNPTEYHCYLDGVKAAAEALGYLVDSAAWGGGIPTDLTLYVLEDKPAPVVVAEVDVYEQEAQKADTTVELPDAGTDAGTE